MIKKPRTVFHIKTALESKLSTRPRAKSLEYLDMFILSKTKARLEQEKENIGRRIRQIERELSMIDKMLDVMEDEISKRKGAAQDTGELKKSIPPKSMKTLTIDY